MKEELIKFLSKFSDFTISQVEELANMMTVKEIKKNTTIVKQGQFCNLCFFVLKGCLRQYVIADGVKKQLPFIQKNLNDQKVRLNKEKLQKIFQV